MSNFSATIKQGALLLLLVASGVLANSTSTSTSSSLESDTRFPPRDYSFDPRPNIDPSFLIPMETLNESSNTKTRDVDVGNALPNGKQSITSGDGLASSSIEETALENKESVNDTELQEGPRAIVHVQTQNFSGEVSYIIHPDNLPPPVFKPMDDLPPLSHSQWRPDLFMKLCCSSDTEAVTSENSDSATSLVSRSSTRNETSLLESDEKNGNEHGDNKDDMGDTGPEDDGEFLELSELTPVVNNSQKVDGFQICEDEDLENCNKSTNDLPKEDDILNTQLPASEGQGQVEPSATSERSANLTDLLVELEALGEVTNKHLIDASSNHTPRYEESSSSTYQDMFNFLKDIANSDGFQNAFLGDLISNFGSLDENAMKLIYSLLIRPLEAAQQGSKKDRVGAAPETKPDNVNHLPFPFGQNFFMLNKDKLPLRDEPANGYNPFLVPPPPRKNPTIRPHAQMHPSPAMLAAESGPSDNAWLPTRSMPRNPSKGLRGDEGVDVITAPPFQNFEVVLGSSLNHEGNKPRVGEWEESPPQVPDIMQPSRSSSQHPLPFNKLRLGLEMPPQDALDALPPGSVLIPPSYVLKQAKLPQIVNKKDGTPGLEIPLSEFLPNLPFRPNDNIPQRLQPPAKPQAHDIPPRLPSFLSILSSAMSHPKPQKSSPVRQRPINRNAFVHRRPPTGPPPPITKLTPPTAKMPTRNPGASYPTPPSPTFTPPPLHNHAAFPPRQPLDKGTPNVLPNSLDPSGLGAPGPISVPVFVSVPPKKSISAGDPLVQPEAEHTVSHEESSNKDLVLKRGDAQGPETLHPVYVDYSDESNVNRSNINYQDHQYYGTDYDLDYYAYHDYYAQEEGGDESLKSEATGPTKSVNSDNTGRLHDVIDSHDSIVVNDTVFSTSHHGSQFHSGILHENTHHITLQSSEVVEGHVLDDREIYHHVPESPFLQSHPGIPVLPTLSEQEKSDLQMLLQNHQMVNSLAEANGTVLTLKESEVLPSSLDQESGTDFMDDDYYDVPATSQRGSLYFSVAPSQPYLPSASPSPVPPSEVNFGGSDFGVSHLWNNVQLIPLAPELFDSVEESSEDSLNLTSLFHDAVPISPVEQPKDNSVDIHLNELDVNIEETNSEDTLTQDEEIENAKFMAYVLIGACCGLALLSVAGIIVIVRFKKTCGSRQIRTRTRLTEQNSVDGSSRHDGGVPGDGLILGGESGHKLGSWFTGRHDNHLGSGKLRSNMTLPNVHDHKREKNKSGSTRDLLSLTSESSNSSCTSSPRQGRGSGNGDTKVAPAEDEPRGSWLHGEYRASHSDLSLSPAQDLPYIPHHYNGRDPHGHPSSSRSTHTTNTAHQQDTFRYRTESSMESEELQQRSSRERRYTGGKEDHERSTSGRRPRYVVSSLESEELDDRLRRREHVHSTTDSEAEDRTTHYDEDEESHDPSCYTGHSRELDETVISRGIVPPTSMTSQELGDHLSRDLKQYQSHRNRQHQEDTQDEAEEGIDRQELRRSQSQASFSRDNVQNEVFLEFDNIFRQHGQYLTGDPLPPASTLGRVSRGTTDTLLSISRANTPDCIDMSHHSTGRHRYHHGHDSAQAPSPPTTPPRFSPPPAPPRPPKPGHLSQPGTPSPKVERGRLAAEEAPRHQRPSASNNNDGERLI